MPFVVYGSVMLLVIPFAAKFIPSRPLEERDIAKYSDKSSDEDIDIGDDTKDYPNIDSSLEEGKPVQITLNTRRRINPFKLVWALL